MPQFFFKMQRNVAFWIALLLILWVPVAWLIAEKAFVIELDSLVEKGQQDSQKMSEEVADSIRRNLHYIAGIPDTFQQALRIWKVLRKFGPNPLPTSLPKKEAIKLWGTDPDIADLSSFLLHIQSSMGVDLIYVVNAAGDCVSASNWSKPDSLVGTNYADRKWFVNARNGQRGMQYAVGRITHIPGLFFAAPIMLDGKFNGVIIAKVDLPSLSFLTRQADVFVTDANGVVIMAHDQNMVMTAQPEASVRKMSEKDKMALYMTSNFPELKIGPWEQQPYEELKHIQNEELPHILASTELNEYGLKVFAENEVSAYPILRREQHNKFLLFVLLGGTLILISGAFVFYFQSIQRTRKVVEESEERLRLLLESVSSGIWGQTTDGICTFINSAAANMLGFEPNELIGKSLHSIVHHSYFDGTHYPPERCPMFATAHDGMQRNESNEVLWRKDGGAFPVEYATYPINRQGELVGAVVVFDDISERKKMEQQMSDREATYSAAIKTSVDGFWAVGISGRILEVNDAYLRRSGYSREEMLRMCVSDVEVNERPEETADHIAQLVKLGGESYESRHRAKDGSVWEVEIAASYIPIAGGKIFCFVKDITERKLQAKLIESEKVKAEAANRAKSDFLANMSHEIRTPMNAVIGFSELALDSSDPDEQRKHLRQILDSSKALLGILNDILDLSKIEARQMSIEATVFDVDELMDSVNRMFTLRAQEKGLEFALARDPQIPGQLIGDPLRLRQILVNLLGNAIKFTHKGKVSLEVKKIESNDAGVSLCFCVRDSGIGMSSEQIDSLFKPFVQADNSITRRFGGTGLGLAICRNLAELMGGNIIVESAAGAGSEFRVQVTLAVASKTQIGKKHNDQEANQSFQHPDAVQSLTGKRVLLVEDNRVNQVLATHLLKKLGLLIDLANNGEEAIRQLQDAKYDIVLMDIQMPVMDGLEATRQIRRDARFATLPIVAMSAGVTLDEQEKCASAGMTGFIGKPIDSVELANKLVDLCLGNDILMS